MKCKYCDNEATRTLIWLLDKQQRPARIRLPWCGCDLMVALRRIWTSPYRVIEGRDYAIEPLVAVVPSPADEIERLRSAIRQAIESAEEEGVDRHRGTDEPRRFVAILRGAVAGDPDHRAGG